MTVTTGTSLETNVTVGGDGGNGGTAGDISLRNTGDISTTGGNAHAIFANSVGGNGGSGGSGVSYLANFGTTKNTIEQIRERTHWNSANLQPMDPVTLGLCSQIDLDLEVEKATRGMPKPEELAEEERLLSAAQTQDWSPMSSSGHEEKEIDEAAVFAKLSSMRREMPEDDEDDHR